MKEGDNALNFFTPSRRSSIEVVKAIRSRIVGRNSDPSSCDVSLESEYEPLGLTLINKSRNLVLKTLPIISDIRTMRAPFAQKLAFGQRMISTQTVGAPDILY